MSTTLLGFLVIGGAATVCMLATGLQKYILGRQLLRSSGTVEAQVEGMEQRRRVMSGSVFDLVVHYTVEEKQYTSKVTLLTAEVPEYKDAQSVMLAYETGNPKNVCLQEKDPLAKAKQEMYTAALLAAVTLLAGLVQFIWPSK